MSADAKVWNDDGGWHGIHDGECRQGQHAGISYDLIAVLVQVERCMEVQSLRWEFRTYPDGQVGLVGYVV